MLSGHLFALRSFNTVLDKVYWGNFDTGDTLTQVTIHLLTDDPCWFGYY